MGERLTDRQIDTVSAGSGGQDIADKKFDNNRLFFNSLALIYSNITIPHRSLNC